MRKNLIIIPVLIFTLFSCKKDDPTIHLKIEGFVQNRENYEPVAGAKIEIITDKSTESVTSDETGYFNLGKFIIGDYIIYISKDGFASETEEIEASYITGSGDNGFEVVKSLICKLDPANEKAELTLYRQVSGGERIAAKNFPYVMTTGHINSAIEGTTDENGLISLSNIPSVVYISIDHEFNGIRYKTKSILNIHDENYLVVHGYQTGASLGIVSTNILDDDGKPVQDFKVDRPISMEFTLPVDTTESWLQLNNNTNWVSDIDISYKWSNNNMKLDITPTSNLDNDNIYELDLNLVSASGKQYYHKGISFSTAE